MDIIVAACVSQFHDSDDEFELLLAYNDGREIGHTMTRAAAKQMASECADAIGDGSPDRRTMTKKIEDRGPATAAQIDAAARYLRETLQASKRLKAWSETERATKKKWLSLAEGTLDAARKSGGEA